MNLLSFNNLRTQQRDVGIDHTCTIVVGDIHGDLNQLIYPLKLFLSDPLRYSIIFLGDYIDRGESNVYIYEIISALYKHPHVTFLFGNHELYDKGTMDYISYHSKYHKGSTGAYIKTFTYELFNALKLQIIYYDEERKILYSHSPLNRPLEIIKAMPITVESAFTYDKDSQHMPYKNIHGHDHIMSSSEKIQMFFNTSTVNMISIDNDASYGMYIMTNAIKKSTKDMPWTNEAYSNVTYIIIDDSDFTRYKVKYEKPIAYADHKRNYNLKSFDEIKKDLLKSCKKGDVIRKYIERMSLDASYEYFIKTYLKGKDVIKLVNDAYVSNVTEHANDGGANIYFHDLPYEYYERIGVDVGVKGFVPIHELYHEHILTEASKGIMNESSKDTAKANAKANAKDAKALKLSTTGGSVTQNINVVVIAIISVTLMVLIITSCILTFYVLKSSDASSQCASLTPL